MFRLPTGEEMENILTKIEIAFELEDLEIWACKEFVDEARKVSLMRVRNR